jgi:hypothetical protein
MTLVFRWRQLGREVLPCTVLVNDHRMHSRAQAYLHTTECWLPARWKNRKILLTRWQRNSDREAGRTEQPATRATQQQRVLCVSSCYTKEY